MHIVSQITWEPGKIFNPAMDIHPMVQEDSEYAICGLCGHGKEDHAEWRDLTLCPGDRIALVYLPRHERTPS